MVHEQNADFGNRHLVGDSNGLDLGGWAGLLRLLLWDRAGWSNLLPFSLGLGGNLPTIGKVFGEEAVVRRLCLWRAEPAQPMGPAVDADPGVSSLRVKPHLRQGMPAIPSHVGYLRTIETDKRYFTVFFSPFRLHP
jgi:hypothetical protein